jgi:hypothetical protein
MYDIYNKKDKQLEYKMEFGRPAACSFGWWLMVGAGLC